MARGRFVSESIATDARLNNLTVEAELVYLKTIPHLDRDGLIEGDPDVLWGRVCPKRRQFLDRMAGYIQEWARVGLVLSYDSEEGVVLWFKGFAKNQIGLRYERETPSRFPPPPGHHFGKDGIAPQPEPPPKLPSPPSSDKTPEGNLSSADSIQHGSGELTEDFRQESGEVPEASGNSAAQLEVKDQDQVKDQSSPPTPSRVEPDGDGDDEKLLRQKLAAKLHSVGVQVTPYSMDRYVDYCSDYGLDAVIAGLTSAANNGKQHHLNYVARCIVTATQGDHRGHNGNAATHSERTPVAQFTQDEWDRWLADQSQADSP